MSTKTAVEKPMGEYPLLHESEGIPLFYPFVPKKAIQEVEAVLSSRWIGQGPRVENFESMFSRKFCRSHSCLAVGSGTDALHLAYVLAGLKEGDEVITPVFTCTATNIALLYQGVQIKFADVDPKTLNISVQHVEKLISEKTRAIVCVHYGGLPCDMDELNRLGKKYNIPVIEDAAQALGASYKGRYIGEISDFTIFSFQAVKHITTGDGGMLSIRDRELVEKGKRIRWFGIDRLGKQQGIWSNDISELGYKYQMNDIAAAIGIAGLETFDLTLFYRQSLFSLYSKELQGVDGIRLIGDQLHDRTHASLLCTAIVENRVEFMNALRAKNIESGQVHYRNDRYSIFGGRQDNLPNMDAIEDKYIVLPLHMKMKESDVHLICETIKAGW